MFSWLEYFLFLHFFLELAPLFFAEIFQGKLQTLWYSISIYPSKHFLKNVIFQHNIITLSKINKISIIFNSYYSVYFQISLMSQCVFLFLTADLFKLKFTPGPVNLKLSFNITFAWHRCVKKCGWENLPLHWSDFFVFLLFIFFGCTTWLGGS